MKGVDVVFVMVYKDKVTYSKLHWERPISNPDTTATKATLDMYSFQFKVT